MNTACVVVTLTTAAVTAAIALADFISPDSSWRTRRRLAWRAFPVAYLCLSAASLALLVVHSSGARH